MDASGNNLRRLTNDAKLIWITSPNWSPNGKQIVLVSWLIGKGVEGKSSGIFIINRDGKNIRQVTKDSKLISAESASWSADGRQIVFAASAAVGKDRNETYVIDINGKTSVNWPMMPMIIITPFGQQVVDKLSLVPDERGTMKSTLWMSMEQILVTWPMSSTWLSTLLLCSILTFGLTDGEFQTNQLGRN